MQFSLVLCADVLVLYVHSTLVKPYYFVTIVLAVFPALCKRRRMFIS